MQVEGKDRAEYDKTRPAIDRILQQAIEKREATFTHIIDCNIK